MQRMTQRFAHELRCQVVDMFGCGVPVCAVDFACLDELVKHDVNGLVFKKDSPSTLADQIYSLLHDFPGNKKLTFLRSGVENVIRWDENWRQNALPVLSRAVSEASNSYLRLVLFIIVFLLVPVSAAVAAAVYR